jgi:hypothetical protein
VFCSEFLVVRKLTAFLRKALFYMGLAPISFVIDFSHFLGHAPMQRVFQQKAVTINIAVYSPTAA